ncbi:hypothetical protein QOT17_018828 [Balamuthia mandrillaris]
MSNDHKCNAQCWDDLSPAELHLLIKKEQASILHLKVTWDELLESLGKHQLVNKDEIFAQLMATKRELYFAEQCIQKLDHALQQAEQRDSQYLSKWLNSLEHQTSNISYLVEVVDVLFKRTNKSVFKCYKTIVINTITHVDKQFDTLTHIINNIADCDRAQPVIPCLSWHEARDLFTTHFGGTELQTRLHNKFFKLSHRPKELVRKVIKRIDNILQQMTEQSSHGASTLASWNQSATCYSRRTQRNMTKLYR